MSLCAPLVCVNFDMFTSHSVLDLCLVHFYFLGSNCHGICLCQGLVYTHLPFLTARIHVSPDKPWGQSVLQLSCEKKEDQLGDQHIIEIFQSTRITVTIPPH